MNSLLIMEVIFSRGRFNVENAVDGKLTVVSLMKDWLSNTKPLTSLIRLEAILEVSNDYENVI